MGNWNITIQGVGPHGNGIIVDAEQMYKEFVEEMQAAGHSIIHSSITSGGAYFDPKFIPPVKPLELNI